ncbi:unnamed protein product [Paramecium pentaurelia]|uniref:Uncharacterized protein n=1 Tax=Paramecium pentaurelia TaxID=43138 RepID=A0A8S1WZR7_9CILI|nr:unnamed protein product [Paramecium pentaurelia]
MNKSLFASLLILLIIGQVSCDTLDDIKDSAIVSTLAAAGITVGAKVGLMAAGFSSIGPVAGSLAAASQAGVGNVVAGSIFSIAQSVAMTGVMSTVLLPASVIGITAGTAYYFYKKE